jgi:HK97 family phage major capsid protein
MTKLQELLLEIKQLREENRRDFADYKDDLAKMPGDVSQRIAKRLDRLEGDDRKSGICKEAEDLQVKYDQMAANDKALSDLGDFKHQGDNPRNGGHQPENAGDYVFAESAKFMNEARRVKRLPRYQTLKHFQGEHAEVKAYRFANWFIATVVKSALASKGVYEHSLVKKSENYCKEFQIEIKAQSEGVNTAGGYLVPPEFSNEIIDLRESYGLFRRFAKIVPMMSDQKTIMRRRSGLTVYNPGEGVAITDSQKGWDAITLAAKKFAVLAIYSSELDEDAMINIGDDLAGEAAYAFALKEDQCGFNGDGTSTYFGITGIRDKIINLSATRADIAGLVVGSGNLYSELVLADFNKVVGRLPEYAETPRAGWYNSKIFWAEVQQKLALAAGGVTAAEIVGGARRPTFLGYPVNVTQVMPKTEANDQVCSLLGDLYLGVSFGDRRQITTAYSSDYKFAEDQLAIRVTQRIDINVHDVGNADATAANREAGPIVGLLTAAS